MKNKLCDFFKDKKVLILGYGLEGKSTYKLLSSLNCCKEIGIADKNTALKDQPTDCTVHLGENYLDSMKGYDIIMKTPGVPLKNTISSDIKKKITCQTDLLMKFYGERVVGITGTKGKSTVSSLVYHFLRNCGKKPLLIGNIGIPPLQKIDEFDNETIIVCELSSHQLEYTFHSPNIAVLLNLYPEHLDHYVSFHEYKNAKENIYLYQQPKDTVIFNIDLMSDRLNYLSMKKISASYKIPCDVYVDNKIHIGDIEIPLTDVKTKLIGFHNIYNIAIALTVINELGIDVNDALTVLPEFNSLEHRLEYVRTVNGAEYINDSISTVPETAIAAVQAFDTVDTLILGGMDRGVDLTKLCKFLNKGAVENIILLPDTGNIIYDSLNEIGFKSNLYVVLNLEEAVKIASEVTKVRCILSPAAASYGFYTNFEERGKDFKRLVEML